jgi:serine protease
MTGLPIGGACGTPGATCTPPGFCLPETGTGYTGGYCSATCTMGACPTGAVCIAISQFGATTNACMSSCATPGSQSTCRTGYVCAPSASSVVQGYCRPLCTNGGLASCAAGQMCNTQTGLCQ